MEQVKKMSTTEANPPVRTVASTQSEMTEVILPNDANTLGNLLGGRLMHFIDLTGAIAAYRHSRTHVVTAAMDHIDFIQPVHVGDLLILKSSVNRAFNTSIEVGVKVWVEDPQTGTHLHVASAYLVFVAVDEHGRRQTAAAGTTRNTRRSPPLQRRASSPRTSRIRISAPQAGAARHRPHHGPDPHQATNLLKE